MSDSASLPTESETPDYGVLRWLVAATFIVILNETLMFNAMPSLMAQFHVNESTVQWLSTAFLLTMAVVIPTTGWFLQRVTTRHAFLGAMGVFCAGTLLAALAPSFAVLLLARVVQATGTAVMMPLLMTTLMTIVLPQDRGRIMGNVTLAMSVAPALGPTASGLILQIASWRWMFVLVLPLAVLLAVAGLRRLPNVGEPTASSLNVPSVILSALGFGGLVFGISQIGNPDAPAPAWPFIAGGLAVLVGFVWLQLVLQRSDRPLLDLRTLRNRTYVLALVLMGIAMMSMFSSMFLLPQYLQGPRELTPFKTGLLMMPGGLAMGLLGPQVGKVFDARGARILMVPGALGVTASLAALTQYDATTSVWIVFPVHMLLMASLACIFTPVFTLGLGAVAPHLYSHASSLLGSFQQVAGAMGVAVVSSVLLSRTTSLAKGGSSELDAAIGGFHWAFAFGALLSLGILVVAFLLPNRPATPPHETAHDGMLAEPVQSS